MSTNHIGWTVYFSATLPATNNAAGFEALVWTKVAGIQSIGSRGLAHETIPVPDLQTGFTPVVKGAASGVDTMMTFREVLAGAVPEAGQAAIQARAENEAGTCSIKLVQGTGAAQAPVTGDRVAYAQGVVHSFRPREMTTNSHAGFSVTFRNNDLWVEATEPV